MKGNGFQESAAAPPAPEQSPGVTEGEAAAIRVIASGNDRGGGPGPNPRQSIRGCAAVGSHRHHYSQKIFFQSSVSDGNVLCGKPRPWIPRVKRCWAGMYGTSSGHTSLCTAPGLSTLTLAIPILNTAAHAARPCWALRCCVTPRCALPRARPPAPNPSACWPRPCAQLTLGFIFSSEDDAQPH